MRLEPTSIFSNRVPIQIGYSHRPEHFIGFFLRANTILTSGLETKTNSECSLSVPDCPNRQARPKSRTLWIMARMFPSVSSFRLKNFDIPIQRLKPDLRSSIPHAHGVA